MVGGLDRGKSEKIKEGKQIKRTKKRVHFVEYINKERPPTMESEGATKYDDENIARKVRDKTVFMHFPHV